MLLPGCAIFGTASALAAVAPSAELLIAAWVLTAATWLVVGAADGLRLGTLAPAEVEHLVTETVLGALRREPGR